METDINFIRDKYGKDHHFVDAQTKILLTESEGFEVQQNEYYNPTNHHSFTIDHSHLSDFVEFGVKHTHEFGTSYKKYCLKENGKYEFDETSLDNSLINTFDTLPEIQSYKDLIESMYYDDTLFSIMDSEIPNSFVERIYANNESNDSRVRIHGCNLQIDGFKKIETYGGEILCIILETTKCIPGLTTLAFDSFKLKKHLKAGNYKIVFSEFPNNYGYIYLPRAVDDGYILFGLYDWGKHTKPYIADKNAHYVADIILLEEEPESIVETIEVLLDDFTLNKRDPIEIIPQNLTKAFYVSPEDIPAGKYYIAGEFLGVLSFETNDVIYKYSALKVYNDFPDNRLLVFDPDGINILMDVPTTYLGNYTDLSAIEIPDGYTLLINVSDPIDDYKEYCNNSKNTVEQIGDGWVNSFIREWLNSCKLANTWWHKKGRFDVFDTRYEFPYIIDGFLSGLSRELRDVLIPRKMDFVDEDGYITTVYDRVTLATPYNYNIIIPDKYSTPIKNDIHFDRYIINDYVSPGNYSYDPIHNVLENKSIGYGTQLLSQDGVLVVKSITEWKHVTSSHKEYMGGYRPILYIGDKKFMSLHSWGSLLGDYEDLDDPYSY